MARYFRRMNQLGFNLDSSNQGTENEEPHVFSVSELNKAIRGSLEGRFPLIWIRGELSNFKAHSSGHWYFGLKDNKAQVNGVMFRGFNSRLKFRPENGMEVLIRGKVTVYEPRGNYQVFCELMEPVGAGALQMAFEQLKKKLSKEGLFDEGRKRLIPPLPKHIAVITSPTGAAIRDILSVLERRCKAVKVTLIPALVQGEGAPASLIKALKLANCLNDIDTIIIGRGGGSMEDLWGFNNEELARAVVNSQIPVISAVGHEVDFTICDFVADLRAPTPSAAAELVVKNVAELLQQLKVLERRLAHTMSHFLRHLRQLIFHSQKQLVDPQRKLQDLNIRCDELESRLQLAFKNFWLGRKANIQLLRQRLGSPLQLINDHRAELRLAERALRDLTRSQLSQVQARYRQAVAQLDALSPLSVVDRGYAIVTKDKAVVKKINQVTKGDKVSIRLSDGCLSAEVEDIKKFKLGENKEGEIHGV